MTVRTRRLARLVFLLTLIAVPEAARAEGMLGTFVRGARRMIFGEDLEVMYITTNAGNAVVMDGSMAIGVPTTSGIRVNLNPQALRQIEVVANGRRMRVSDCTPHGNARRHCALPGR